MWISIAILLFFIAGIVMAWQGLLPDFLLEHDPALPALWLLMFLVGLSLGADRKLGSILRTLHPKILLMPLATTLGTFLGACAASLIVPWSVANCLAAGSGFGYYSLSSVFITQYKGAELGAIALVCNILRELFTLLLAYPVFRLAGPAAAISCGGCTTMDTTLPLLSRITGTAWLMPAIIHAMVLDFSVPFWVTLFCSL